MATPDPAMADYLRFHAPRFAHVLKALRPYVRPGQRVLDIGWSRLTSDIHAQFGVTVDALGFDADGPIATGRYYHFDLNDCQHGTRCRTDLPQYDAIVFAEVIEHLHTAPTLVLRWLADRLVPGGIMLIQTPNAVALPRRVKMALGYHPFERIREDATNPGHFREYTAAELAADARAVGLSVESVGIHSYFDFRYARHGATRSREKILGAVKNIAYPLLPSSMRPGLTVIVRSPLAAARAA